jgi:Ribonuclease HI
MTAAIYTDSLIILKSIENVNNHNFLVEKIRKKIRTLESCNWKLELSRIKAHVGILGNELADRTAKEAEQDVELKECYSKIPIIP